MISPEQRAANIPISLVYENADECRKTQKQIADAIREAVEETCNGPWAKSLIQKCKADARKAASVEWEPYIGHRTQDPVCEMFNPFTDTPYPCTCGLDDLRKEMEAK